MPGLTADPSAGAPGAALASDPHTVGADPAAAGMVCDMLHPLIYLIIIGGLYWPVQRPNVAAVFWYALEVLRRCDTLQRGAGGIISACIDLVSWAIERVQSQEKPL